MDIESYKLIYKIDKNKDHIRLLGTKFVNRNKMLGYFIYKNKKYPLNDTIETKNIQDEKELKINLFFYQKIYNKSCMFRHCDTLLKVFQSDIKEKYFYFSYKKTNFEKNESLNDFIELNAIQENSLYQNLMDDDDAIYDYSSTQGKHQKDPNKSTVVEVFNKLNKTLNVNNNSIILSEMFQIAILYYLYLICLNGIQQMLLI